jgi:hypothetical protein
MLPISACVSLAFFAPSPQTPARAGLPGEREALVPVDVPLVRFGGGPTFNANGASFLDYDADGWIDLYVNSNAGLWHNEAGTAFVRVADLDIFLPPIGVRYGSACGDYDNDGLPDIACSPRGNCLFLLRNLGGTGDFREVARDPAVVSGDLSCEMYGESFAWADVDEDGDLDLWATAYPDEVQAGSGGNQFLENLGPSGPGGAYRFAQRTVESGLGNPPNVNRPEGAQFVDADRDGDVDGFANNTLYKNVSATGVPRFVPLVRASTGILLASVLDEGTVFLDYDLDGDQDLVVVYRARNVLWENEGDGTFVDASVQLQQPGSGATEGCSAEDWDLDGDLDLTTAGIFRRNLLVETGAPFLRLATTSFPDLALELCLPAWGDWDKDGDPDCALANFGGPGGFYQNASYDAATSPLERLSLRVRPVRDSSAVARGLESEFGATVELRVHGDTSGFVRRRFVASSHGYLQQSEYALTLPLPPGPDPAAPARGVTFDLLVDFPSLPENGILRVDRTVNPVLGGIELASLVDREITVFRSGLVRLGGADHEPRPGFSHRLASTGALVLPFRGRALAEPVAAPEQGWTVGMEIDTSLATGPTRVEELVLDGQLAPSGVARCDANLILLDVTAGAPPRRVRAEERVTAPRNDRSFLALDWVLKPHHVYRILCRVTELRSSPMAGATGTALSNRGALSFASPNPCDDAAAAGALVDPTTSFLELRYRAHGPPSSGARR